MSKNADCPCFEPNPCNVDRPCFVHANCGACSDHGYVYESTAENMQELMSMPDWEQYKVPCPYCATSPGQGEGGT